MEDGSTINRIAKLHPKLRNEVALIVSDIISKGINIRITQGLRTIAEQDALYAQGRTKPGKIVTNAKGGSSMHNFALAVDFVLLRPDKVISWDMNEDIDKDGKKDWMEVVEVFKKYGWEWGGDFKSIKDYPHFQKTFGKKLADLRIMPKDKDGYVIF